MIRIIYLLISAGMHYPGNYPSEHLLIINLRETKWSEMMVNLNIKCLIEYFHN